MKKSTFILSLYLSVSSLFAQHNFQVIVLGSGGGPKESDVSGYLIAPADSQDFIALDAGSLLGGLYTVYEKGNFGGIALDPNSLFHPALDVLRHHVQAYFLSHAHLDHVMGLVINSTVDLSKPIFAIDRVIDFLRDHLFNGKIWPNFGSEGNAPCFSQYQYQRLKLEEKISIPQTAMSVQPFLLSHPNEYLSTAFLIESNDSYVVYFGDTAPDHLESKKRMDVVWKKLAPLVLEKKLKGIFLECSYLDKPASELFGHLDAKYMMQELRHFACLVNPEHPEIALQGLHILVTHMKDPLMKESLFRETIAQELEKCNDLGVIFIFPSQGDLLFL
jgi:3',5'-cyclic-nucleotide phosphodiesterase